MKKHITLLLISINAMVYSQNMQVQNMVNYLRSKEYDKAKGAADAAAVHEQTKGSAKMWMYRGNVYKAIFMDTAKKTRDIDNEAEEKALEAYVTCLRIDSKENIYKDEVKGPLVQAVAATSNKFNFYKYDKQYEKAAKCLDLLESALPYDFDGGIKRSNVTKEKLLFKKFDLYQNAGDAVKMKEYADKLIEIKYKDPKIYTDMIGASLKQKDTTAALQYIEKGKAMFEDNMNIINSELDIFLARKQTDVLKDKLKAAIAVDENNEILHLILGNIYRKTKQFDDAEKEYLKAIEIKNDSENANYNLGVLYYDAAKDYNEKLSTMAMKDPKAKEYETKSNEYFKKAFTYLEAAYDIGKDASMKPVLKRLAARLGEKEKMEKYK